MKLQCSCVVTVSLYEVTAFMCSYKASLYEVTVFMCSYRVFV